MKTLLVMVILSLAVPVFAQTPQQPTLDPAVQALADQLAQVGCRAEQITAAQTINALQKENADLKSKLAAHDPPAKKH